MAIIVVIDGQGGRMGSQFIEKWKKHEKNLENGLENKQDQKQEGKHQIIAVGTNSVATSSMLKAGADLAATGENPVIVNANKADYIVGPIGIMAADALIGEITEQMACAVARSKAKKILIPVNSCGFYVVGQKDYSMGELIDDAVETICSVTCK